jgi:Uma2 family endonuclease
MTTATLEIPKTITATEMEKNPAVWKEFELYEGVPIQMTYAKPEHGILLGRLFFFLNKWILENGGSGEVTGGETGIRLNEKERYSFDLGWSALPLKGDEILQTPLDLMVEIASDANSAEHLIHKCMRYLEYGAKEVWVLFPEDKLLQVYQPDKTAKIFQEGTYEPSYMNGFSLDLGKLFRK